MYTVLLPVDADVARARSQAAMVTQLPGTDHVDVVLLHVFDDRSTAETTLPTQIPAGQAAVKRLEAAGIQTDLQSGHGDPVQAILQVGNYVGADVIVMGGRKRSPLGSALFGSVSQQVTLEADRPVVVTGDEIDDGTPSHRCRSCGEEYFADPADEITECRECGESTVTRIDEESIPTP